MSSAILQCGGRSERPALEACAGSILFIGSGLFYGNSVGGYRQDRWMKAFLEKRYDCEVVDYSSVVPRFGCAGSWEDYSRFRIEARAGAKASPSVKEGSAAEVLRKIKHYVIYEVFNPLLVWQIAYIHAKCKGRTFDYIFSSSPPFSSNIIGLSLLKRGIGRRLIVDFRDEWADNVYLPKSAFMDRRRIEGKVVRNASVCLTVSRYSEANLKHLYGVDHIRCVYNAPDVHYRSNGNHRNTEPENNEAGGIDVVYTGSMAVRLYDYEKLAGMINAIHRMYGDRIRFSFYGASDELRKYGVPGNCRFLRQVSLEEARNRQQRSDSLLFLAANYPQNGGVVSAKIFEYLQSGKPILPLFVAEGSDIHYIISEACGFCPCINNVDQAVALFRDIELKTAQEVLPSVRKPFFMEDLLNAYPKFVDTLEPRPHG